MLIRHGTRPELRFGAAVYWAAACSASRKASCADCEYVGCCGCWNDGCYGPGCGCMESWFND
ncbi:hypothetical protein CS006_01910 [Bifidobacterium primatium]|uniref:Uncharacterized protein n=1 Tax=Bifidobacterium primatium TaxID=2045438 RepID=A0A2M9HAU0_9BIFI|nr:hypothetical protein [Bifidobacterium primatium]PJM73933.1 hypothetical protein CS006_01910 [Bifidobacterium primatium]